METGEPGGKPPARGPNDQPPKQGSLLRELKKQEKINKREGFGRERKNKRNFKTI